MNHAANRSASVPARAEFVREGPRIVAVICLSCGRAAVSTRLWLRRSIARSTGTTARTAIGEGESSLVCMLCNQAIEADVEIEAEVRRREVEFDRLLEQTACGPADPGVRAENDTAP